MILLSGPADLKYLARIINNNPVVHLCAGDTTTFSFSSEVAAGFTNPSYQWQVSTNSGISWKDIDGATQLLYTRKPTQPGVHLYRLTTVNGENGQPFPAALLHRFWKSTYMPTLL
jgi:hypothetical protein